jgi:hypothetical protein
MPISPLAEQLALQAEFIVETLDETQYQYTESIDPEAGVYDCDCNGFVGFVLESLAPNHYAAIPREPAQPRPRAFAYVDFFNSLTQSPQPQWQKIERIADARQGDIMAWRFPRIVPGEDTGHVVFLAETPNPDGAGVFTVRVCDSAAAPHFRDTRGPGDDQFPNGVGSGVINFKANQQGEPTAFLFGPGAAYVTVAIAIGRAV